MTCVEKKKKRKKKPPNPFLDATGRPVVQRINCTAGASSISPGMTRFPASAQENGFFLISAVAPQVVMYARTKRNESEQVNRAQETLSGGCYLFIE